ncbi:MAG: PhoH family protein [Ignavibacteria bacterium]
MRMHKGSFFKFLRDTTEKNISLTGIDLLSFTGVNEENLNFLKEKFSGTIIVVRGDNVFLKSGDEKEFSTASRMIDEMVFLAKRQERVTADDVRLIADLIDDTRNEKTAGENGNQDRGDVILYNKNDLIKPRTPTQIEYCNTISENDIIFAIGPAGTGKTYLAVAFAVAALKNKQVGKIVLARPAVEAGESLGFLPGDLSEKIDPYLKPLFDAFEAMLPYEKLRGYFEKNIIEIVPLAYMRGRTLNNSFVILDEAQNSTTMQMKMFLTRLGPNSKAIITGDVTQIDLASKEMSGLIQASEILKGIEGVAFVYFNKNDVVRHRLVKEIINAYEKHEGG